MKTIALIPARGGSKGIPRKNLRPVAGRPLIYFAIQACLAASCIDVVAVSTDDEEIALFAERFGAVVLMRPPGLADDFTTLDPVIAFAVNQAEQQLDMYFDFIVTVQPTAPLISSGHISDAVRDLQSNDIDTVLSVVDNRHLNWTMAGGIPKPQYTERVNRQLLPECYKETGAIIASTRSQLMTGTRIGERVHLLQIPHDKSIDIDTYSDLAICELLLQRKKIVINVIGYNSVGLGHVYRGLTLAHELIHFDLEFVCEKRSDLALDKIRDQNYSVRVCENGRFLDACLELKPDLVINDILDTDEEFITQLKQAGLQVINFEDMGSGAEVADLVINALYSGENLPDHFLIGSPYFCLRDEFIYLPEKLFSANVNRILLSFGGVDEGNLTLRCLKLVSPACLENGISIDVIIGPGYLHKQQLLSCVDGLDYLDITVSEDTRRISDFMYRADLAMTSGGRTVLELAALKVPTITICQNERETMHSFASVENGVVNLGHRDSVNDDEIQKTVKDLMKNDGARKGMVDKMCACDLVNGKRRVIEKITKLLSV
jgi:CMP-N-acetylneuraminic acid synthetase/spore coat polysaccharide biosynthesis predicted glycosyltransferase SpsG